MAPDDDRLLTPRDVAGILGKSISTLQKWRHDRIGPPWIMRHKRIYYWRSKLYRWLDRGDSPSTPPSPTSPDTPDPEVLSPRRRRLIAPILDVDTAPIDYPPDDYTPDDYAPDDRMGHP